MQRGQGEVGRFSARAFASRNEQKGGEGVLPLAELRQRITKAGTLMVMYEKEANSSPKTQADIVHAQREMKVMKDEILSELLHSKSLLQRMQKGLGS